MFCGFFFHFDALKGANSTFLLYAQQSHIRVHRCQIQSSDGCEDLRRGQQTKLDSRFKKKNSCLGKYGICLQSKNSYCLLTSFCTGVILSSELSEFLIKMFSFKIAVPQKLQFPKFDFIQTQNWNIRNSGEFMTVSYIPILHCGKDRYDKEKMFLCFLASK